MEAATLEIVTLCLSSLVMVTVCDPLVEPTNWLPKLTDEGLVAMFACATDPKANKIVKAAANI